MTEEKEHPTTSDEAVDRAAHGSEVPTPRTDKWEYEQECNYDVPWEENCRQLEREVLRLGAALNEQNERWGLYGNESQAALRAFKELNASAGLPNAAPSHAEK